MNNKEGVFMFRITRGMSRNGRIYLDRSSAIRAARLARERPRRRALAAVAVRKPARCVIGNAFARIGLLQRRVRSRGGAV